MINRRLFPGFLIVFILAVFISGCEYPTPIPAITKIWLDVPLDGLTLAEGQPLQIEGHAASPEEVVKIEIWVNGDIQFEVDNPPVEGRLARYSQAWTPPGPGAYTIQTLAFGGDGSVSEPGIARIQVGTAVAEEISPPEEVPPPEEATPTYTPTPVPTSTFTPTPPPPEVVVDFWADPAAINAGACFTVHWHAENVSRVIFGGSDQQFDGAYSDCLCKDERYTLTVIHLDGSEEKRSVDIAVQGTCATITPTPDQVAPDVPVLLKPLNGSDLGCVASAMLRWEAVTDPSGIAQYQVEIQRHPGDNNWQTLSGSPFTGIAETNREINLECGWAYHWRVRAIDNQGNIGNWSDWFTFDVPLF